MLLHYDNTHAGQLVMVDDPIANIHEQAILWRERVLPDDALPPPTGLHDDTTVLFLSGHRADIYTLPGVYVSREAVCSPDPLAQQLEFAASVQMQPYLDYAAQAVALMLDAYPHLADAAIALAAGDGDPETFTVLPADLDAAMDSGYAHTYGGPDTHMPRQGYPFV